MTSTFLSTIIRHCISSYLGLVGSSKKCPPKAEDRHRHWPSEHLSLLHFETYIKSFHTYTPTSYNNIRINYAIRVCWTQASKLRSGWPRFCQYMPATLCSWYKPVDWPAISAHQVGVTNFQRLHASHAYHSIATTCTYGHAVLRQAQRVALPSPQSGSIALYEANQARWLQCWLHEALPCRQP